MRAKQKGMTLLEVMVATMILAVSASLISMGVRGALTGTTQRKFTVMANWVAQNRLNELLLMEQVYKVGTTRGEVVNAGLTWYWEQKITQRDAMGIKLKRIEIFVKLDEDGEDHYAQITALTGDKK